jgi:hypothetical protein
VKRSVPLVLLSILVGVLLANAPPASATDISFESRTYVPASGIDGGDSHVLLYEYLMFGAENLARPGLYLRAGGWGRTDLADETYGRKTNGDLQYAFLGWRSPQLNTEARVGRVSLTSGVARNEVFDGLMLGSDLPAGFDVTVYGGIPVETDEDGRSNDSIYGARVSQGRAGLYRIGASYLKEENDGSVSREEAGADVFFAPLPLVELTGSSLYNAIANEWARHDYRLALGPFIRRVRLTATWADTDYRYYFQSPVHPVFIPEDPDADETLNRIGGEVEIELDGGFRIAGDYIAYNYDLSGDAQAYGAAVDWAGKGLTAGAAYRQMHGDEAENRYQEFRGYVTALLGPVRTALSAEHLAYDEEINGQDSATTATLSLGYDLSRSLNITATGEYGVTPEFDREVKGLLAVLWRYDASMKKGGTK